MKTKELLEEIKEDKTLQETIETLKKAREYAQGFKKRMERKEGELRERLRTYSENMEKKHKNIEDVDDFESSIEITESKSDINRKLAIMMNAKNREWTQNTNYRKSMYQYWTYIAPILADLDKSKNENAQRIHDITVKYEKDISEHMNNMVVLEDAIEEFMEIGGEISMYRYSKAVAHQYGMSTVEQYALMTSEQYKDTQDL